jgi:L-fuculose-phosphate aldolase
MSMTDAALRVELVQVCRVLWERGLSAGFDGNSAVRTGRGSVLVTPAGAHKGLLTPEGLVEVDDVHGRSLDGLTPTTELAMHLEVFRRRPDITAVVHSHAPSAVAMTLLPGAQLNGVLPELVIALGQVPTVPYRRPGTTALAVAVGEALAQHDGVVIERHGTVCVGRTLREALARTEMIEHAARILMTAWSVGEPTRLDDAEWQAFLAQRRGDAAGT